MEYRELAEWLATLKDKPERIRESFVPKIVKDFQIPIPVARKLLDLNEATEVKSFSKATEDLIYFYDRDRIYTGVKEIDDFTQGFFPGQIVLLAGRTRTGKTTIALNFIDMFVRNNVPVLFLSLEMSAARIAERILRMYQGRRATPEKIKQYVMSGLLEHLVTGVIPEEYYENLYIYDKGAVPADQLDYVLAKAEEIIGKKVGVVVIDYFELVKAYGKDSLEKATQSSKLIADFAKRNQILTIILHQCNRAAEGSEIQIGHVRNAGEEDADLVLGLWRPYYEDEANNPELEFIIIQMVVLKNRDGYETRWNLLIPVDTLKISKIEKPSAQSPLEEAKTEEKEQQFIVDVDEEGADEFDDFGF